MDWDIRTPPDVQYSYVIVGDSLGVSRIKSRRRRRSRIPVWAFAEGEARISAQTLTGAGGDAGFTDEGAHQDGRAVQHALAGQSWLNRKLLFAASPLLGALALSGALALTYKAGDGNMAGADAPPAVHADQQPAASLHAGTPAPKSKRIYDRLPTSQERGEAEWQAPREEAASTPVPADPLSLPQTPAAVADPGPQAAGSAHVFTPADPPNAPRRVRTVVVRLDGSVERPAEAATPLVTAAAPPLEPAAPPPLETAGAPAQPLAAPETTGALQTAHLAAPPSPAPAAPARAPASTHVAAKIGLPLPSPRREGFDAMPLPKRKPEEFTRPAAPAKQKVTYRAPKKTRPPESAWRPDAFSPN